MAAAHTALDRAVDAIQIGIALENIQTLCQRGFGEWQCNTNKFNLEPCQIRNEPCTPTPLAQH